MRSRIASDRGLSSPPSWSYQPLESYWEQKMVDDFLRLLWRSSSISYCSDSVGFSRIHSSMISRIGGGESSDTHIDLKVVDCTLYNSVNLIKGDSFLRAPLDSGKFMEVHVFIGIGGTPFFAALQGFLQSQTNCPFTMWTLEQPYFSRSALPFHGNVRDVS